MERDDRDDLPMWTIYDHPSDYPEFYVVRRCVVRRGQVVHDFTGGLYETLEQARADVPPWATCLGRQDEDSPSILEVWI